MSYELILAVLSSGAALLSVLVSTFGLVRRQVALLLDRRSLRNARTAEVLAEANLESLGKLLYETLGKTSVASFARDVQVQSKLQAALDSIREFVNQGGEEGGSPESWEGVPDDSEGLGRTGTSEAAKAAEAGDSWSALARMRRDLELYLLRAMGRDRSQSKLTARQLLEIGKRYNYLEKRDFLRLTWAVRIANAAIHGEDVDVASVLEAIAFIDEFTSRELPAGSWELPPTALKGRPEMRSPE